VNFSEALADLEARQPERMVPDLSRITALAELLDHPERKYPSIHVTGTNGKTTTARLVTALACEHGLPTGTCTSPHLHALTERLALCGDAISEDEFAEEYERLQPFLREVDRLGERVTYFETLTALAYVWFADKPVSLGVFEVGMGGTWDATNLVAGDVAVLCPIALDHPELGSTVREVATEKAGIIKEGKVAVCRDQPREALRVIEARCAEMESRLLLEARDFALAGRLQGVGGQVLAVQGIHGRYEDLRLHLFGEHAARNAAAALVAVEAFLDRPLSRESVELAFASATSPGRLEVLARRPLLVVDGAHNPAGAEAMTRAVREAFTWDTLHLVMACSANKDIDGIVRAVAPLGPSVYATRNSSARSAPVERVASASRDAGLETQELGSVPEALAAARAEAAEADLILVTGSLYTVADARSALTTTTTTQDG
jgi:dihydrofolate synthase/folylpolyglutamate synthase